MKWLIWMKKVFNENVLGFLILGIILFAVFALGGAMDLAIYALLFVGFVFLLVLIYGFFQSKGVDGSQLIDSLEELGDVLKEGQDSITYLKMSDKEQAMYNAMKKSKKKD